MNSLSNRHINLTTTKKIVTLILAGVLSVLLYVPTFATELPSEGKPLPLTAFDGAEFSPPEMIMPVDNTREVLLGSYTIKQYLNQGWMLTTDDSFDSSDFPASKTFLVVTNMRTDGINKKVKAGISYVNWFGNDTFFAYTMVDLVGKTIFQTTKTPDKNVKYYGGIFNDTNDKMYGSFYLYAVHTD